MKEKLIRVLANYHGLSQGLQNELSNCIQIFRVKKEAYLFQEGEYCPYFYFLSRGLLVTTTHLQERQLTTAIIREGNFVCPVKGMYGLSPSEDSVCAIEDAELLGLHAGDLFYFFDRYPEMNMVMRCIMEGCFKQSYEWSKRIREGTSKEKYLYLLNHIPEHFHRIPLIHIANYLDIRFDTLLRIRKEVEEEKDEQLYTRVFDKLVGRLNEHQDFLRKTITVGDLARELGVSRNQLNFLIRMKYNKNFNQLINTLRIDFVKEVFARDGKWKHFTIEAIGFEAGFKSRSVFFSEFRKYTGITPGAYIQQNLK